jgi:uroporphyrin-III C-methyltransferase / precorrin-2 dehydrogenase / sirohydrochlorin ferrochelatase
VDYLPLFTLIKQQPCLVVGGGDVAARKINLLLRAGADVHVVAEHINDAIQQLARAQQLRVTQARFVAHHLDGMMIIIAATDDAAVNAEISTLARARQRWVNVVDQPELCNFIMPSIIDRSPVVVAVSTGGTSPVLARLLRARLEATIPASYGRLANLVGKYRQRAREVFDNVTRRRFWERIIQGPIAELVFSGKDTDAEQLLNEALTHGAEPGEHLGEVYLVGAGPGDPDLLTFRALRLMQQCDVCVYDRLVSAPIMDLVRRDAEFIYAGKARNDHAIPQEEINQLLARLANAGKRVLRLKGGDPFIFGRGGEEIATLAAEGIPFQIVPGITAASGCAAYAGIPLTHRDYAQSVVFATGHLKDGSVNLDWDHLIQPQQTIVFYMGLHGIEVICRELMARGLPPSLPVAVVEKGTTPEQKVHLATLASLPSLTQQIHIKPPTLLIVGDVVRLHDQLKWYHNQT